MKAYEAPKWHFDFMAGFSIRIAADLLMVENGNASLLWIQARRTAAPTKAHLGMLQRLLLLKVKDTDYENVGLTILDMQELNNGKRVLRSYLLGDLIIPSQDEAQTMLQMFADAHALLIAEGFEKTREEHKFKKRREPPGQGTIMF